MFGTNVPDVMREATRLTLAGRLTEAMTLLRGAGAAPPLPSFREAYARYGSWSPRGGASSFWSKAPASGGAPALTGTFVKRTHAGSAGARDYKVYVPSVAPGAPMPLVVMLHGCTQSPDDFAAGTRMNEVAEAGGFVVAYPAQSASANCSKCWNWFKPGDQRRGAGEPSLIAGITADLLRDHPVDPACVYIAGFSSGGAAAATMAITYPDVYAALGVHSGLPHGAASDMPSAFSAMRGARRGGVRGTGAVVPAIGFHGERDTTVHPSNADAVIAQARSAATTDLRRAVERHQPSGKRAYERTIHSRRDMPMFEQWLVHGAGHAWSGGSVTGTYTDPQGPDAAREMMRFFRRHRLAR